MNNLYREKIIENRPFVGYRIGIVVKDHYHNETITADTYSLNSLKEVEEFAEQFSQYDAAGQYIQGKVSKLLKELGINGEFEHLNIFEHTAEGEVWQVDFHSPDFAERHGYKELAKTGLPLLP